MKPSDGSQSSKRRAHADALRSRSRRTCCYRDRNRTSSRRRYQSRSRRSRSTSSEDRPRAPRTGCSNRSTAFRSTPRCCRSSFHRHRGTSSEGRPQAPRTGCSNRSTAFRSTPRCCRSSFHRHRGTSSEGRPPALRRCCSSRSRASRSTRSCRRSTLRRRRGTSSEDRPPAPSISCSNRSRASRSTGTYRSTWCLGSDTSSEDRPPAPSISCSNRSRACRNTATIRCIARPTSCSCPRAGLRAIATRTAVALLVAALAVALASHPVGLALGTHAAALASAAVVIAAVRRTGAGRAVDPATAEWASGICRPCRARRSIRSPSGRTPRPRGKHPPRTFRLCRCRSSIAPETCRPYLSRHTPLLRTYRRCTTCRNSPRSSNTSRSPCTPPRLAWSGPHFPPSTREPGRSSSSCPWRAEGRLTAWGPVEQPMRDRATEKPKDASAGRRSMVPTCVSNHRAKSDLQIRPTLAPRPDRRWEVLGTCRLDRRARIRPIALGSDPAQCGMRRTAFSHSASCGLRTAAGNGRHAPRELLEHAERGAAELVRCRVHQTERSDRRPARPFEL